MCQFVDSLHWNSPREQGQIRFEISGWHCTSFTRWNPLCNVNITLYSAAHLVHEVQCTLPSYCVIPDNENCKSSRSYVVFRVTKQSSLKTNFFWPMKKHINNCICWTSDLKIYFLINTVANLINYKLISLPCYSGNRFYLRLRYFSISFRASNA